MCNNSHVGLAGASQNWWRWGANLVHGRMPVAGEIIVAVFVVAGLAAAGVYSVAYRQEYAHLASDSRAMAEQQIAVLKSEFDKQHSVPAILAEDAGVISAVTEPTPDKSLAISQKLERLQRETNSADIYIVDKNGRTLSASNYALPTSFVGSNYSFRRYFSDALRYGEGQQFALGTVSRRPGLYIARRISAGGRPAGVVVVKVEFDAIEASWRQPDSATFVTSASGEVLLSSNRERRFQKTPRPLPAQIVTILPAQIDSWRLSLFSSLKEANKAALNAALVASLTVCLLGTLLAWLWRRRRLAEERRTAERMYRDDLERDVASRTVELQEANDRLSREMLERQQAQGRLNALQEDLVQANKLAQLGQITAGVAHEINQPLAAMRALAENCITMLEQKPGKRQQGVVEQNLSNIIRLNERIGHITSELKAFSRKGTSHAEPVSLNDTLNSALLLNRPRSRGNKVHLVREAIDAKIMVIGGRFRLEQALVNLLQNAYEALENTKKPEVRITATMDDDWVYLKIGDNGPGLTATVLSQIFTPFVTTKVSGLGLGLVIAHDIIRDFGGELTADNGPVGALFTLKLRKVAPEVRA